MPVLEHTIEARFDPVALGAGPQTGFIYCAVEDAQGNRLWRHDFKGRDIEQGGGELRFSTDGTPARLVFWEYSEANGWGKRIDTRLDGTLVVRDASPAEVLEAWAGAITATPGKVKRSLHRLNHCVGCEKRKEAKWYLRAAVALLPKKVRLRHSDMLHATCGGCGCPLVPKSYANLPQGQNCPLGLW